MNTAEPSRAAGEPEGTASSFTPAVPEEQPAPWEQIEDGRYQPRRIRGSCRGRVLG